MPFRPVFRSRITLTHVASAVLLALSGAATAVGPPQPLQVSRSSDIKAMAGESLMVHMHDGLGVPTLMRASGEARMRGLAIARANSDAEALARAHMTAHGDLYRLQPADVSSLKLREARTLPNGGHLLRFIQQVDGIDVFREQVTLLLGADGGLEAIGGFASGSDGLRGRTADAFRLDAPTALSHVLASTGKAAGGSLRVLRSEGDWQFIGAPTKSAHDALAEPARTKPVFFRTSHGLVPGHYLEVALAQGDDVIWFAYVVSAKTGKVLYRHGMQEHADHAYRVWASPYSPHTPDPSPQGPMAVPHPIGVPAVFEPAVAPPSLVTLSSVPFSRNDPWLASGATVTSGNNVDAYADLVSPSGFSAGDLRPGITAPGVFDRTFDPTLEPDANAEQIAAATTQLFYTVNWLHDSFYDSGFDEVAGNAQVSNFGRGGVEGDPILAEAQDYGGLNNANMLTPADGASPRMQMYVFTGSEAAAISVTGQTNGDFAGGTAAWGPSQFDVSGQVVLANPLRACSPLINTAEIAGRVALVERGDCNFSPKVLAAQAAGASAVIVADNMPGAVAGMGGTEPGVTIPSLRITQTSGQAIINGIAAGSVDARLRRVHAPDRDGTLDNTIVAHEWGHYISNRLIGNANGLTTQQARGMGEGWGDFHALLLMVQDFHVSIPTNYNWRGTYAVGGYALGKPSLPGAEDYASYYGLRRYPYSTDLTKNPLTFRHIDDSQPLPPSPPPGKTTEANSAVHNTGEVWGNMLWSCYASLLNAHPFQEAQDRMKRMLVTAYKLTPVDPTFTEARDALLIALANADPADSQRCATTFAQRGAGAGAISPGRGEPNNLGVVESYATGAAVNALSLSADDSVLSCDNDGILDAGERGMLRIGLRNLGFSPSTGGTTSVSSPQQVTFPAGASAPLPALALYASTEVDLTIDSNAGQQEVITLMIDTENDGASHSAVFDVLGGYDIAASTSERFEADAAGWTTSIAPGMPAILEWQVKALTPTQHVAHADDGNAPGISWLYTPPLHASGAPLVLEVSHRHVFESDDTAHWDGGVIELSTDGGSSWADLSSFGFSSYNGTLAANPGNPASGRDAFVGTSAGFPAFVPLTIDLGTQFAGQTVQLRFGMATDTYVGAHGWDIDEMLATGIIGLPFRDRIPDQAACHTLGIIAGNNQHVRTDEVFPSVLSVQAKTAGGLPQAGYEVTFTLPDTGASASFAGAGKTFSTTTDLAGRAHSPPLVANGVAGEYQVIVRMGAQTVTFTLENLAVPLFSDGFEESSTGRQGFSGNPNPCEHKGTRAPPGFPASQRRIRH